MTSVVGRVRLTALWLGLPVSVALFALLRSFAGLRIPFAASQALFLLVSWTSAAVWVMVWRGEERPDDRTTWGLLALAALAIAAGESALSGYQVFVDIRGPAGLALADVLNALGAAVFLAALIRLYTSSRPSRLASARRLADVIGILAVSYAGLEGLLRAVSRRVSGGESASTALEAAYVLVGLVILGAALLNALGGMAGERRVPDRVLTTGLAVYGLSVTLWPLWHVFVRAAGPDPVEVALAALFMASYYVILMAGVYRLRAPSGLTRTAETFAPLGIPERMPFDVIAPTVLLVAIPVLGVAAMRPSADSGAPGIDLAAMVVASTMLVVRTGIDAVESGQLRRRAGTDPVTGLPDVRAINARLGDCMRLYERYGQPVSVVVADIHDLGRVNALYGRAEGDRILNQFASGLAGTVGRAGAVGRLGSDEFVVILEGADAEAASSQAERLRSAVSGVSTSTGLPIRASWGVATCPKDSLRSRDLITKAYAAQRWAETRGVDAVVAYAPDTIDVFDLVGRTTTAEERAELDVLLAVAMASDHRNPATRYHSRNVAALAVRVAERMGLSPLALRDVEVAALLHDIGKTSVPDDVLAKRGPRTRAQEARYREHPVVGARIVGASRLRRIAPSVRGHHERWDGTGYPDGLAGTMIPLPARIVAACDAFECMVAGRPDRAPLSMAAALQDLDQNIGAAYDPDVVEALLAVCADSTVREAAYRTGVM